MNDTSRLTAHERELFTEVVEASLRVVGRHHFFGWTQGMVQTLLPHEILLCGVDDGSRQGMSMHRFTGTRYFKDEHFAAVCAPRDGLVPRLLVEWQATGAPVLLDGQAGECNGRAVLTEMVKRNELRNIAAHAIRGGGRGIVGFYGFSRIPGALGPHTAYIAELIVPYIHATFVRVLGNEQKSAGSSSRSGRAVTARETEILRWIKQGKTNLEIARALELSPWTVKNHVQTILKKLSAQTRGHAVARAMSLGILDSAD
jgi:transcriptional regulator EpsA